MNYYSIIKRKCYTWKPRLLGKTIASGLFTFVLIMNKREEVLTQNVVLTIKLAKNVQRANQNKNLLTEKS